MSKPRARWWGFVRRMIRDYPGLKNALIGLQQQTVTASLSGMPSGGGENRSTETAALRRLPDPDDQAAYEAVAKAVELTALKPGGPEKMELIRLMYWARCPKTIYGAADELHISTRTAQRWHAQFVRTVAVCHGLTPDKKVGTPEP